MINTVIGTPLGYIMKLFYDLTLNYGLSVVYFTIAIKMLLFPLNMWVHRNSMTMLSLKVQTNRLAVKYAGSPERVAKEQAAIYRRAKYRPMLSLFPLLLQILVIIGLVMVVYNPMQHLFHIEPAIRDSLNAVAQSIETTDSLRELDTVRLIQTGLYDSQFIAASDLATVNLLKTLDFGFLGFDLSHTPSVRSFDIYWLFPVLAALTTLLYSYLQNILNIVQRTTRGFLSKWGFAIFLTLFSLYFGFIVPGASGTYWIVSNLVAIVILFLLNLIYPWRKYVNYDELMQSERDLDQVKAAKKAAQPSPEMVKRAKDDYARFFAADNGNKELVFFQIRNGYLRYYRKVVQQILDNSDITIHFITSDHTDAVLNMEHPRLKTYLINGNNLIYTFMKIDACMMVMTVPDLGTMHLKRSLLNKSVEYCYIDHSICSTHMVVRPGAVDNFDTIFCVGPNQRDEIRESEKLYNLPEKKLIDFGYPLLEEMIASYKPTKREGKTRVVIAPSHQDDCILDSCLKPLVDGLLEAGYSVIVRPHPHYLTHNPGKMEQFAAEHKDCADLLVELGNANSESVYGSDVLITDWSAVAFEFSFTTKKPCIFVNTPMKVLNPDYVKYENQPIEITFRDKLGIAIDIDETPNIAKYVQKVLNEKDAYVASIEKCIERSVYNLGDCSHIASEYIISQIEENRRNPKSPF